MSSSCSIVASAAGASAAASVEPGVPAAAVEAAVAAAASEAMRALALCSRHAASREATCSRAAATALQLRLQGARRVKMRSDAAHNPTHAEQKAAHTFDLNQCNTHIPTRAFRAAPRTRKGTSAEYAAPTLAPESGSRFAVRLRRWPGRRVAAAREARSEDLRGHDHATEEPFPSKRESVLFKSGSVR